MTSSSNGPVASNGTRIVLRDMTRADIRAVRRIESVAYDDAWPSRAFDAELANAFARYRVAIEEPAPASDQPERAATLGVQGVLGAIATLRRRLTRRTRPDRIVGFIGVWSCMYQTPMNPTMRSGLVRRMRRRRSVAMAPSTPNVAARSG